MNWRRGLKRLLVVGCAGWLLFLVFVVPFFAIQSEIESRKYIDALSPVWKEQLDDSIKRSSFPFQWGEALQGAKEQPWVVPFVLLPPFIAFGLLYGGIWTGIWLASGFKRTP